MTSIVGTQPGTFQYDANGDQISGTLNGVHRSISYTSYSKPLTVRTSGAAVTFYYNADREKFARVDESDGKSTTTYYLGNYELVTIANGRSIVTQQKAYIGPHTIHIKTQDDSNSANNTTRIYEMLHNHLGSVTDITDENGNVTQHFSYTLFGEQKQIRGEIPTNPITNRGFTGHENIEGVHLIHMDGRIYDPVIGRFLSADPFVQDPSNSQCLNRYSYCINNPLAFVDPTGFGFWGSLFRSIGAAITDMWHGIKASLQNPYVATALGVAIGVATFGIGLAVSAACLASYNGVVTLANGGNVGNALCAVGLTFATVGIWHGIGSMLENIKSNTFGGLVTRSLVHGMVGGGIRAVEGESFSDGFLAAAVAETLPINQIGSIDQNAMMTIAGRTAAASIVGGTVAALTGGNFANGATTAAYAELFNELGHLGAAAMQQYKSEEALKIAMGPNSVVVGMRPLNLDCRYRLCKEMYSNNLSHKHNLDWAHSHIFWTGPIKSSGGFDLHSEGYFPFEGVIEDEDFSGKSISEYKFGPIHHNIIQTSSESEMDRVSHPVGFTAKNGWQWPFIRNCHDHVDTVFLSMGLVAQ